MTIKSSYAKAISFILGLFFIVSGIGKMLETHVFVTDVVSYGIPEKLAQLGILIPTFEIILGLMLVFFIRSKDMALISLITLVFFTIGFAYGHLFAGVEDCGCFGAFEALATPPWVSFLRNFILIAMSFLLLKNPVKHSGVIQQWQWASMIVALLVSGIWSGQTSVDPVVNTAGANASNASSSLEALNDPLLNKNVSQTALGSVGTFEENKRYLVFVFSPTCPHCWDATENVKAYKEVGLVDEIYGVVVQGAQGTPMYVERFQPNFEIKQIPQADILRLTNAYPKIFYVTRNTIKNIQYADIKSPWTMYQTFMSL
jgi:hypothetical protein